MTTEFETAARAEAEEYAKTPRMNVGTVRDRIAQAHQDGALWARSQEPTEEEVEAAAEALWALDHPDSPFESLAESEKQNPDMAVFYRDLARAALRAARGLG